MVNDVQSARTASVRLPDTGYATSAAGLVDPIVRALGVVQDFGNGRRYTMQSDCIEESTVQLLSELKSRNPEAYTRVRKRLLDEYEEELDELVGDNHPFLSMIDSHRDDPILAEIMREEREERAA
jgi:hypothetical protein